VSLDAFISRQDTEEVFSIWLRAIDQSQAVQDACISQLRTYLTRICQDIFELESNGHKSGWIWLLLTNWDYTTHSLAVPSPDYWNLGDAFDITLYTSRDPTHSDIASSRSEISRDQKAYLESTVNTIDHQM